jgi:hypothetical protein
MALTAGDPGGGSVKNTTGTVSPPTLSNNKVLVGGKILIKMDNQIIGFANEASCSDAYGLQPIHVLGQLSPIDYVPTDARHSINLTVMVMKDSSLAMANLEPTGAGNYGFLKQATIGSFDSVITDMSADTNVGTLDTSNKGALRVLHGKSFSIEILSPTWTSGAQATTVSVVRYDNCYFNGGSVRFNANQITVHQCEFVALYRRGWLMETPASAYISG